MTKKPKVVKAVKAVSVDTKIDRQTTPIIGELVRLSRRIEKLEEKVHKVVTTGVITLGVVAFIAIALLVSI